LDVTLITTQEFRQFYFMGISIKNMHGYYEYLNGKDIPESSKQVFKLANDSLLPIIEKGIPENLSHLIVATSCPDMIAPSLGQMLGEQYNHLFSSCHILDIVQGCAGGVTAMILGSQLSELNKSSVMVVQADAAKKATSKSRDINKSFGNGSFACLISYENSAKRLLHYKSHQYKGLHEVVTINLGHDADVIIKEKKDIVSDPRKHLGLSMNNSLAIKLFRNAEMFYKEFVKESSAPDMIILHQVNPLIISHLKSVFQKYKTEFVDVSELTGNCGAASVGIALNKVKDTIKGKKIMLCSFGTGGVITAGLWQN
jgi:3-oxoacyl-[acyl-carrier-protein] synthase III